MASSLYASNSFRKDVVSLLDGLFAYVISILKEDNLYYLHPLVQDMLWPTLHKFVEPVLMHWPGKKLRERALCTAMEHIHYEDENTCYICIEPVNKVLNMLCCWVKDPNSEAFKLHLPRIYDYLWLAEDGMKMQVLEDCPGDLSLWYHHISKCAWPFSTADHGWPISDCTSEGLKAALLLSKLPSETVGEPLNVTKLYDAVNVILSLQNAYGGLATYKLTRSYPWMELINPAETFGDIVIDSLYVECTSAAIQPLTSFRKCYPGHQQQEIDICIKKAVNFMERIQASDGSWFAASYPPKIQC